MSIIAQLVSKSFGEPPTKVLQDISLEIKSGEFVSLTGRSGSGKSTLLYLLGALDNPTTGSVTIDSQNIQTATQKDLHLLRNQAIGFVFQFHYLLPELSALENILMPARKAEREAERLPRAMSLLEDFGLADKAHRLPRQLSGGEQQRIAIARALIMQPKYLFADEPTGALDSINGEIVMKIFERTHQQENTSVILVTHDPAFASRAQRQIRLVDGRLA
jgi:lipoprotein-releasing system ATP-binding protein